MKKRGFAVVLTALILIISIQQNAYAQTPSTQTPFDASKSFSWLVSQSQNGNYGDIMTTAIAAVALKQSGLLQQADQAMNYIKATKDAASNCWPSGNCKPLDTAFAVWAISEFGEQTATSQDWLRSALTAALQNNWWLQIITTENGTCTLSYPGSQGPQEETIRVDAGVFPGCTATPTQTFFDLNRCLKEKNVVINNPSVTFDVNCRGLSPNTMIAVVFNKGNEYTLVEQATAERSLVTINNGCFGDTNKGSCVKDVSLYANWLLSEVEAPINTNAWLRSTYDSFKAFDNALMFLASKTNEKTFLDDLVKLQSNDGSFNKDVRDTAIAVLALKKAGNTEPVTAAVEFLKTKQNADGSWESNTFKTAVVLYSAFTGANIVITPSLEGGGGIGGSICGDNICSSDETEVTCPRDCSIQSSDCFVDQKCEVQFRENTQNCPLDCSCGDGVCDAVEQSSGLCTEDCGTTPTGEEAFCGNDIVESYEECDGSDDGACPGLCQSDCTCPLEEESGGFGWLWTLLIILVLAAAGFFFYTKTKKGGGKKPGIQRPEFRPYTSQLEAMQQKQTPRVQYTPPPATPEHPSKMEDELERSIREAKKLLKKL